MSTDENKQIVREAFEALMAGDLSPLRELLAPDAVLHQCGILHPIPAEAILQRNLPGGPHFRDRRFALERMVGEGDTVALHWRTSGRYADPEAPRLDGTPVSFPSMSFVRIENGRIAEIWNIQDMSTLQTQLLQAQEASTRGEGFEP